MMVKQFSNLLFYNLTKNIKHPDEFSINGADNTLNTAQLAQLDIVIDTCIGLGYEFVRIKDLIPSLTTLQHTTVQKTTIQQTTIQQTTIQQTIIQQTTVHQTIIQQTTIQQTLIKQTTVDQTTPIEETTVQQTIVQHTTVGQTPMNIDRVSAASSTNISVATFVFVLFSQFFFKNHIFLSCN